ncbi:MAG: serine hydrolase domain-containing protein [Bradymonadaceae bacterium]
MITRALLLSFVFILALQGTAFAEDPPPSSPIDADELETFLEPLFARHLSERNIPGATFAAVHGGEIILARGFGLANIEAGDPVLPDKHLFNTGSVTKLFTTTAVMQQVEAKSLSLDADVNDYLEALEVPSTFDEPITLSHLLTHTAGFDESSFGILAMSPETVPPLADMLAKNLPNRIRPPGKEYQYSNHGMTLAGHLVEIGSGEEFSSYVADHIFKPLGMERSVIGIRPDLEDDMATGYARVGGEFVAVPPVAMSITPAGGLNATATDIARFMSAQLQGGRLGNDRILAPETTALMQTTRFRAHPKLSGSPLGFYERFQNDLRIIEHAGDAVEGFSTLLFLIPDKDLGFFVSYNASGGAFARFELLGEILNHYFPAEAPPSIEPPSDFLERQDDYVGTYRVNRHIRSTFLRPVGKVVSMYIVVDGNDDGTLTLHYPSNIVPADRLVEVEKDLFRRVDEDVYVSFERDGDRVSKVHVGSPLLFTAERFPFYDSANFYVFLLGFFQLVFLSGCFVFPVLSLVRRIRKRPPSEQARRRQKWLATGVSILAMIFLMSYAALTMIQVIGVPGWAYVVFTIPFAIIALTIPLVMMVPDVWKSEEWSLPGKLYMSLIAGAALAFPFALYAFRMLGYHF